MAAERRIIALRSLRSRLRLFSGYFWQALVALLPMIMACGDREYSRTDTGSANAQPVLVSEVHDTLCARVRGSGTVAYDSTAWNRLVGRFVLSMSGATGRASGKMATGELLLRPAHAARRRLKLQTGRSNDIDFLLTGWTDVDFAALGGFEFNVSPSSTDSLRPGVEMYEPQIIVVGAPFGSLDAGLALEIVETSARGFVGRWIDTGLRVPSAGGRFCALRR